MSTFQWPDYVIFAAFLGISLAIGVYHALTGGRQRTTQEFIMANRSLKVLPTAISLLVSYQSAIMVLGVAAEMYTKGAGYWPLSIVGFCLAGLLTERLIVPWMYPLQLVSVNEYLERRYASKCVRIAGASLGLISGVLYMGTATYAPAIALKAATGCPVTVSIPVMAFICISYTALGGMRAVIWTDVFQFLIMIGGMAAIMIKGIIVVGGMGEIFRLCGDYGRLEILNWNPDPTVRHTVWGFVFGWTMQWANIYGFGQSSIQRYCATGTLREARLVILLNIPALVMMTSIASVTGLTVFAYYAHTRCDPIANREVTTANQLLSHMVTTLFAEAPGFSGLFLSTLYGGALSTVSSSLSAAAANCWEDILKDKLSLLSESQQALLNRLLVIVFGTLSIGVAFVVALLPGPITQISISFAGAVQGPLCGLFILGGIARLAEWKGAIVGCLTGFALNLWVSLGAHAMPKLHPSLPPTSVEGCALVTTANWTEVTSSCTEGWIAVTKPELHIMSNELDRTGLERLYSISYLWYVLLGASVTVIVGLATSFVSVMISKDKKETDIDERLLIPFRQCLSFSCTDSTDTTKSKNNILEDNAVVSVAEKDQSVQITTL